MKRPFLLSFEVPGEPPTMPANSPGELHEMWGTFVLKTLSAFRWVPPFAQGLVRELRVRWALEEAGLDYRDMLIGPPEQKTEAYRELQPFGQVPMMRDGDMVLFESGAIVLYLAERSPVLMPSDAQGRERVRCWMFAALNSVEPAVQTLAEMDLFAAGEEWSRLRRPAVVERVQSRLTCLAEWLGSHHYLEGEFSAGDLLMTTVLRILRHTDLLSEFPSLGTYKARCEGRPAFQRALDAHMAPFAENAPGA